MLLPRRFNQLIGLLITSTVLIVGCDQTEDVEESQDAHVCEHLSFGPLLDIDAAKTMRAAQDSLLIDDQYRIQANLHTRYDIHLNRDSSGQYGGFIPYEPISGSGDYILYMDKAVDVTIFNTISSDSILLAEALVGYSSDCDAVAYRGTYELNSEELYLLSFEGLEEGIVGVLFPLATEADHDH